MSPTAIGIAAFTIGCRRIASASAAATFPGEASRWKIAFSTSWSLDPRAPKTASNPAEVWVKAAWDSTLTRQTVINSPAARAMPPAVISVESACWRSER